MKDNLEGSRRTEKWIAGREKEEERKERIADQSLIRLMLSVVCRTF
jgi:hypothetical protein